MEDDIVPLIAWEVSGDVHIYDEFYHHRKNSLPVCFLPKSI